MNRGFDFSEDQVVLHLTNPVEEHILQNMKKQLTDHLRSKLHNTKLVVTGELKPSEGKKVIYTAREKFEHLAEKNPAIKELKERFGLDFDF